jgi:hypothetical protein
MPKKNRTDWLDRLADRVFRGLIWLMHRLPWRRGSAPWAGSSPMSGPVGGLWRRAENLG